MKRVIFCDFDGTITVQETFVGMLKHFAPQLSAQLMPEMYALRLSLRAGVRQILESIRSSDYPHIIEYSRAQSIRLGFTDLLDFCDQHNILFVVVSGGLRCMVETVLGDLVDRVHNIYAVDVETTGTYLQVRSAFAGETELVDKVKIMSLYQADQTIAIGDSVTDLNMGMQADQVFARDRLAEYLKSRNKNYIAWDNFLEIRDYLKSVTYG